MPTDSNHNMYHALLLLMMRSKQHMAALMEQKSMTPVQGIVLLLFEPAQGKTMQELTQLMACDASNTTGLVDRLEAQGLILRQADPNDRRVKVISLSKKGQQCRLDIFASMHKAEVADLSRLTVTEQATFTALVNKLLLA